MILPRLLRKIKIRIALGFCRVDILENDKDYHDEQNVWLHLFEITAILIGGYCPRRFEQCGLFVSRILNDFHLPPLFSHFDNCSSCSPYQALFGQSCINQKEEEENDGGGSLNSIFCSFIIRIYFPGMN